MENRRRRIFSSYESKAPPFTINQSGNEHYSPPRLTSFKPQHTPVRKSDIVNPAVSEYRLLSPLDESVMSNSFHGFTSPASRASLNSNYLRRRSHRRYSPPSYYKSPSRFNTQPSDPYRSPSPPPEHSISVPVMIPIPETTPSRVQTMISRFQTAVDYGISPALFGEPEDDTYSFFEKIDTPEGPRVIDVRKRTLNYTLNVPQKRRKLQVDGSHQMNSRPSLHIQPPSYVRKGSPTPARVLRDISGYTKYGETLLDQPESEQVLEAEPEQEDMLGTINFEDDVSLTEDALDNLFGRDTDHHEALKNMRESRISLSPIPVYKKKEKETHQVPKPVTVDEEEEEVDNTTNTIAFDRYTVDRGNVEEEREADYAAAAAEEAADNTTKITAFDRYTADLETVVDEEEADDVVAEGEGGKFDNATNTAAFGWYTDDREIAKDREANVVAAEGEEVGHTENTAAFDGYTADRGIAEKAREAYDAATEEEEVDNDIIFAAFDQYTADREIVEEEGKADDVSAEEKEEHENEIHQVLKTAHPETVQEDEEADKKHITETSINQTLAKETDATTHAFEDEERDADVHKIAIAREEEEQEVDIPINITAFDLYAADREVVEEEVDDRAADKEEQEKEIHHVLSPVAAEEQEGEAQNATGITAFDQYTVHHEDVEEEVQADDRAAEEEEQEKEIRHAPKTVTAEEQEEEAHKATDITTFDQYTSHRDDEENEEANEEGEEADKLATGEENGTSGIASSEIEEEIYKVTNEIPVDQMANQRRASTPKMDREDQALAHGSMGHVGTSSPVVEAEHKQTIDADLKQTLVQETDIKTTKDMDDEERELDMSIMEEVGIMTSSFHEEEETHVRSPVVERLSLSPLADHQQRDQGAVERRPSSPTTDQEELALDRMLMEEVDAFGSVESIASVEKENYAVPSPEQSFFAPRTPSPMQESRYRERLQSGYTGQPRSALEVIKDTLSQSQLPTPPRSSPNVSVIKGQDVLLKKMETTELNNSAAQLHSAYSSSRQNKAQPKRDANEMDVVAEAISQVMAPYQTSENDPNVKDALKRFKRSTYEQLSQQAILFSEHGEMQWKLRQTKNHNKQLRARLLEVRLQRQGVKTALHSERKIFESRESSRHEQFETHGFLKDLKQLRNKKIEGTL